MGRGFGGGGLRGGGLGAGLAGLGGGGRNRGGGRDLGGGGGFGGGEANACPGTKTVVETEMSSIDIFTLDATAR